MISEELLINYGAEIKQYDKNEMLFERSQQAHFYYQIKKGGIKMFNITEDGKEFVPGFFKAGESFAEPPLLGDFPYPANAITTAPSDIYRLRKEQFFNLLIAHPEVHLALTKILCNRIRYKSMIMNEVSVHNPEHQILSLLRYFKQHAATDTNNKYEIPLTRQQIADLTGLRVETVIRSIKNLATQEALEIINRKVYI